MSAISRRRRRHTASLPPSSLFSWMKFRWLSQGPPSECTCCVLLYFAVVNPIRGEVVGTSRSGFIVGITNYPRSLLSSTLRRCEAPIVLGRLDDGSNRTRAALCVRGLTARTLWGNFRLPSCSFLPSTTTLNACLYLFAFLRPSFASSRHEDSILNTYPGGKLYLRYFSNHSMYC